MPTIVLKTVLLKPTFVKLGAFLGLAALGTAALLLFAMPITESAHDNPVVVATIGVGPGARGIQINPTMNRVYVSNNGIDPGTISVIDGATDSVISTITVGTNPASISVDATFNRIYVSNADDNTVTVINLANNTVMDTLDVGATPRNMGINTITNRIYVSNNGDGTVSVIKGGANQVVNTITLGAGVASRNQVINEETNQIYVADRDGSTVFVIDGATNTVTPIAVGNAPHSLGLNTVTNRVYVPNQEDNTVSVIDGATSTVETIGVGIRPRQAQVDPDANLIYVANLGSDDISVINGADNTVIATVSLAVDAEPDHLVLSRDTDRLYIGNRNGTISIIDTTNNTLLDTITVGTGRNSLKVNPLTDRVYVVNRNIDTVSVIADATVVGAYVQLPTITGAAPPSSDCDAVAEAGRAVVRIDGPPDLYICTGAEWVSLP